MEKPVNVAFHGVALSPAIENEIRKRVADLEQFYPRLIGCSVVVEGPGRRHQRGGPYDVQLDLRIPNSEPILISRQNQERLERAVDDAFDVAARRLEDAARRQRFDVKAHAEPARGRVTRLSPERDYGLLETTDGREIYFHRNSVLGDFDELKLGTEVRFQEEAGEQGPQASTVVVET
jgi:cold shock CspA family protein